MYKYSTRQNSIYLITMKKAESIYLQALRKVVEEYYSAHSQVFITFKYQGINFFPPKKIGDTEITFIRYTNLQQEQWQEDGYLKFLEVYPVDVVSNFIRIQIGASLSLKVLPNNFDSIANKLTVAERDTFTELMKRKQKTNDLFINIENYSFDFLYDCDKACFTLGQYSRRVLL